jgi:hypothetical protein
MRGTHDPFPDNPETALFKELEKALNPTFGAIIAEQAVDAPSGGVGLLERSDEVDRMGLSLEDLLREEITADSGMPDLGAEGERYLKQRTRVNEMLMILGRTDSLDEAMLAYRLMWESDKEERVLIQHSYEAIPEILHLNDQEYAQLDKKYYT